MAKDTNDKSVPSLHLDAKFENPYNFVPAFPRDIDHCTLGDAEPSGHHRYHADNWSGRISVELTTVTPLLIPDQSAEDSNGHKSFGIRTDDAGAPYLPPTSLKGALRAAYEAVTNSRMGVWSKSHDLRLAFRLPADSALGLIPVRIENVIDNGKKRLAAVEHEAVPLRFYSKTEKDRKRGTEILKRETQSRFMATEYSGMPPPAICAGSMRPTLWRRVGVEAMRSSMDRISRTRPRSDCFLKSMTRESFASRRT